MLLRIIDVSEQQEAKDCVKVIFTAPDQSTISYRTEYFPSFYTKNFSSLKEWYFDKYQLDSPKNDQNFISKYINLGQNMGDKLLGDDSEIYKIIKIIEENGYQNLFVTVESENLSFFKEQWETIVLPESKYILSSTVKGFFRTRPQQDSLSIINENDEFIKINADIQLKILNIFVGNSNESYMYDGLIDSLLYNNLFNYELLYFDNAESYRKSIKSLACKADIIIFNGDVTSDNSQKYYNEKYITQKDVVELIECTGPEFIIVNSSFYSFKEEKLDRESGLAKLAMFILDTTKKSVLGFSNSSQNWVYSYCIKLIFEKLASGLSIGQSIVEVRKSIQKKQEYDELSITPTPFQPWSLLQFYGINHSKLVSTPQAKLNINDSERFRTIRSKLHGFININLPPNTVTLVENSFPLAIANVQKYKSLAILAPQGYGKSQLAHEIALVTIYKGFDKGFRFDFSKDSYTSSTMLEMIAQTIDQPTNDADKIYAALAKLKSIFVFENIDSIESLNYVNNFLEKLEGDNVTVFTMCKDQEISHNLKPYLLHLPTLPVVSKLILGAETYRASLQEESSDEIEKVYQKFISAVSAPFLIKKLVPIIVKSSDEKLKEELYEEFSKSEPNECMSKFYLWGFSKLSNTTKKLFLAFKDLKGIYLEILNATLSPGQDFQPAMQLLEKIGDGADYSKCLEELEMFDFLNRYPYGRTINEDSLNLLKMSVFSIDDSSSQENSTLVSLILCESVRRVIFHLNKNQNQTISFNILANRGLLAVNMEILWGAEEYDQFDKTLGTIDHFLKQNGIHDEISEWSYHLLKKQSTKNLNLTTNLKFSANYLKLAIYALTEKNVNDESAFSDIVNIAYDWLINESKVTQTEYLELNMLCLKFLEKFFLLENNYLKLIKVSEVMLNIFIENKLDQFSISTTKMIIHCFTELKEFSQCEKYELLLLDSILSNKDIPSFVSQQIQLSVVSSRISRGDGNLALSLLNKIENVSDSNPNMLIPISLLKADIAYLKNNLHEACKEYSIILDNLYSKNQDIKQLEFIIEKLMLIQKEIGEEEFDKILDEQNVSSLKDILEPVQS